MSRGLSRSVLLIAVAVIAFGHVRAAEREADTAAGPVLQRFLTIDDPTPTEYRALRHLDAKAEHFVSSAWMDVWTEADRNGFRYRIAAEGGSDSIRSRVFRALLETERQSWASGAPDRAGVTPVNYTFEDLGPRTDGLAGLRVKPKRKDVLLVDGAIFLQPADGDLVRMEGQLSKAPSFWTRRVEIVRSYRRFLGVRMPVALESIANVMIYGRSAFTMTYEYESINGQRVGTAQLRAVGAPAHP
jgi:hypothetical protein